MKRCHGARCAASCSARLCVFIQTVSRATVKNAFAGNLLSREEAMREDDVFDKISQAVKFYQPHRGLFIRNGDRLYGDISGVAPRKREHYIRIKKRARYNVLLFASNFLLSRWISLIVLHYDIFIQFINVIFNFFFNFYGSFNFSFLFYKTNLCVIIN